MHSIQRFVMSAFVVGMTSLTLVAAAAADVPKIMPADPNSIPAHEQINKGLSLALTLFVIVLIVVILSCVLKIINSLRAGDGMAGGSVAALVLSLVFLGLTLNQGTGYLTGWTNYFS